MRWDDIKIGSCYSSFDDFVFKVLEKSEEWMCVLRYSYNHNICSCEFIGREEEDYIEDWNVVSEDIFDRLIWSNRNTLILAPDIS